MLFTVAAHTNTRWILGMIALGCVLSTLLSMVILWVGLGLWVALTWSVYQNSKGHSSWFTQWIPKQINTLNVSWGHLSTTDSTDINPNEGDENEKMKARLKIKVVSKIKTPLMTLSPQPYTSTPISCTNGGYAQHF